MNPLRRQFLRQAAAFRPRLERLEPRDCPSCTVFQREQTLVVLGDDEANRLLQTGKAPPLGELLEKGVNDLTTEDLLFAYLLGTYVLEAQPEKATAILVSTGLGKPSARAFEGALGMDLADFEPHLTRWLSERR